MIKLRNLADVQVVTLKQNGSLTVGADVDNDFVITKGNIIGVQAFVSAAGTGTLPVIDILLNGTSIYGTTKLSFALTALEATYQPLATDPTPVNRGDILTLKVTTAFGTTQSKDLVVKLLIRVAKQSAPGASYQGDFGLATGDAE